MIAGVILAAGDSSRMGFPKQLAEYKGKTILETVIDTVDENFSESLVVLGHENDTITEKLDFKESTILINENWEEGIVSSIRTALFYLSDNKEIHSAMIFMADQPSVNSKIIKKLLNIKNKEDEVVISKYRYKLNYPILIPRYFWSKLELITHDNLLGEDDSLYKNFDLIDFFDSSEYKSKIANFNFLEPTDYDEQNDF
ncbi:MAG: nucleotidyltransferase family protein [Candidatus Actinomarinales bacterium]|nr:MAG: nucleotidyltransferase family protein [Candidatus Actinomarinales bacterium]